MLVSGAGAGVETKAILSYFAFAVYAAHISQIIYREVINKRFGFVANAPNQPAVRFRVCFLRMGGATRSTVPSLSR